MGDLVLTLPIKYPCPIYLGYILGMNVQKHNKVAYRNGKGITKALESPFYKSHSLINYDESQAHHARGYCYEVIQRKRRLNDQTPVQLAHYILQHAKMRFLEFLNILRVHFQTEHLRLIYMGKT